MYSYRSDSVEREVKSSWGENAVKLKAVMLFGVTATLCTFCYLDQAKSAEPTERSETVSFREQIEECMKPQIASLARLSAGKTLNVLILTTRDGQITDIDVLNKHIVSLERGRADLMHSLKQETIDLCSPLRLPDGLPEDREIFKIQVPFLFVAKSGE
tara:strand:- start:27 stop:500 length:474 start_codon:yes stop_codon:yes gene_type:complete